MNETAKRKHESWPETVTIRMDGSRRGRVRIVDLDEWELGGTVEGFCLGEEIAEYRLVKRPI